MITQTALVLQFFANALIFKPSQNRRYCTKRKYPTHSVIFYRNALKSLHIFHLKSISYSLIEGDGIMKACTLKRREANHGNSKHCGIKNGCSECAGTARR
jgi:hypothetical protein